MSNDSCDKIDNFNKMPEHCCGTKVYSDTWIIDYQKILDRTNKILIKSPSYFAGSKKELEWSLRLFPNGDEFVSAGKFISVYPVIIGNNFTHPIRAQFQISLMNYIRKIICCQSFSVDLKEKQVATLPTYSKFTSPPFPVYLFNPVYGQRDDSYVVHCTVSLKQEVNSWNLSNDFESLLRSQKFCDVTLQVNEKKFPAHKNVLASRSSVFAAMFYHEMSENKINVVTITDMNSDVLDDLLLFLYTGRSKFLDERTFELRAVCDLLSAADKYNVEILKKLCANSLERNLSADNACEILSLADVHSVGYLKECAVHFINVYASSVIKTEGWNNVLKTSPVLIADLYIAYVRATGTSDDSDE